jgi:hypothetical protein
LRLLVAEDVVDESERLPAPVGDNTSVLGVGIEPLAGVGVGETAVALPATPGIPEPPVPENPFSMVFDIPGRGVFIAP